MQILFQFAFSLLIASHSIREVEIVVSVVIIFSLSEAGPYEVDSEGQPSKSHPDFKDEVNNEPLEEELGGASIHEME